MTLWNYLALSVWRRETWYAILVVSGLVFRSSLICRLAQILAEDFSSCFSSDAALMVGRSVQTLWPHAPGLLTHGMC